MALIGVEPGQPGEPPALEGEGLRSRRGREAVIDRSVAMLTGLQVGDTFTIKSIQGTKEQFYTLRVAGISDGRQYSLQPVGRRAAAAPGTRCGRRPWLAASRR